MFDLLPRRHRGVWLALLLLLPIASTAQTAPAPAVHTISLPGQPLAQALLDYANQAGLDLIIGNVDLAGLRSPPLQGQYTALDGLSALLAGSGVRYQTLRNPDSGRLTVRLTGITPVSGSSDHQLEGVVVSATRGYNVAGKSARKITVISQQQIERQLAITDDPGQVLANLIPSFSPSRQKLSNSGESFRGRSPLFLIDGVPQSNPLRDGGRDSYTIDLSMVERIEVVYGASAEHGLGATGGIINFITKRPEKEGFHQHAAVSLTSDDDVQRDGLGHKLNYQFTGQTQRWDILAAATRQERGVFYDGNDQVIGTAYPGEIQDSTSYDLLLKLGYWLDDNQNVTLTANHFDLEGHNDYEPVAGNRAEGIPTTAQRGDPEGDPAFNRVTTLRLGYSHGNWLGNEINAQIYNQRFEGQFGGLYSGSFQDPDIAPVGELFDQTRNESEKTGSQFTLKRRGLFNDRLSIATGFDVLSDETSQKLIQTGRTYVPETTYVNYAAFFQGDVNVTRKLTVSGGVRYEYAKLDVDSYRTVAANNGVLVEGGSPDFDETLYNLGLTYQITDWAQLFTSYSEGFGMADVGRVLRGIETAGQSVDTLLDLRPIVTDNREIGVRFNWQPVSIELSYFESDSDFGERLVEENGVFKVNREKVEIKGFEFTGDWHVNAAHDLRLGYSRSEGKSDTNNDGRVDTKLTGINIAPDRISLGWNARWSAGLSSFVQANHYLSRDFDDPQLEFDGYTLVDASLVQRLPVGRVSVGIENLMDEDYFTYYSQAARASDDYYFKGRGRTFTLGYQVDF
ncbi:TonB-dependent receptor [Alcanivorax sp. N3-2A]|nr:TonB-dependent receptor [Alcanivorax sp. N3-2A]|tara:strand:+ start:29248 stop:31629 length:2382 start_codon:yes stop_codon:yes gene_type:complete